MIHRHHISLFCRYLLEFETLMNAETKAEMYVEMWNIPQDETVVMGSTLTAPIVRCQ